MTFNKNKVLMWSGVSVAGLILLLALLIALLPFIARVSFENWAEDQGMSGSIAKVEIALTDGQLRLSDLKLLDAYNKGLQVGEVFVQVHMRDLWHKRITIEDVQIDRLSLDASRDQAGELTVAGLTQRERAEPGKEEEPWQVTLAPARMTAVRLCMDSTETLGQPAYAACTNLQSLTWQGAMQLITGTAATAPSLSMKGDLKLVGFNVDDTLRARRLLEIRHLGLSGSAMTAPSLVFNGDLQLAGVSIDDTSHARRLLQAGELSLSGIGLKGMADVSIRQISGSGIKSLQRSAEAADDYLFAWQQFDLSDVALRESNIHLAEVALEGLTANLSRDKQGTFELQHYLIINQQQLQPAEAAAADSLDKRPSVSIGKLSLSGGNRLNFVDEAVTPVVKLSFENIALTLDRIDTSQPEQASDFTLATQIGQFGQFEASGKATLFAKRPTISAKGKVLALNIGELSAYAREFLQHKIKSGQLDADLDIKIEQGKLDSKAELTLHKFYVEPLKAEEKDPYKEGLGVPLTTALSLLREKDDRIAITLPVTGDVAAPDFSLNDAINKVMVKAIKTTVLSYYSPFGLISLAKGAINLATALRFEPVAFTQNSSQLDARGIEKLQTMSKLLNERPGVHLVVCGHASMADQLVLFPPAPVEEPDATESAERPDSKLKQPALTASQREALVSLAVRRGEAVKHYLVNELGIGADRLILCNPEYVAKDKRPPRVEISI